MSVLIDIDYLGDLHCKATHGPSQQAFVTDAPVDNGGKGESFSPTDLVATALGACLSTVMALYANRTGLDLSALRVRVEKEMTSVPLRRIGTLRVVITMPAGLAADERTKLERVAELCPVRQSLHPDVNVEMRFVYPD